MSGPREVDGALLPRRRRWACEDCAERQRGPCTHHGAPPLFSDEHELELQRLEREWPAKRLA